MDNDIKEKISLMKFMTRKAFPRYNFYLFSIYMFVRLRVLLSYCRKFKMAEVSRHFLTGTYGVKAIPDQLHSEIVMENIPVGQIGDTTNAIIVPYDLFVRFSSENPLYRVGNTLWLNITAFSHDSILNRLSIEQNDFANIKRCIDTITDSVTRKESALRKLAPKSHRYVEQYVTHRTVSIVPSKRVDSCCVYATEQEIFNMKAKFGIHFADDNFKVKLSPITGPLSALKLATAAEISCLNVQHDVGSDLIDTILNRYFKTPKLIHEGDVFGIPLKSKYTAQFLNKYSELIKTNKMLYFKCVKLRCGKADLDTTNALCKTSQEIYDIPAFVVKGYTDLVLGPFINSFFPKRRSYALKLRQSVCVDSHILSLCPYGLDQVFNEINKSMKPFLVEQSVSPIHSLLKVRPKPIFLVSAAEGSAKNILAKVLPFCNGINQLTYNCHEMMSSTAKQTESKIDQMIQNAKNCSPVLVILTQFQVFAIDAERNEDSRIVDYFSKRILDLLENFTKKPIVFLALSDGSDLKPSIARLFLESFTIPCPSKGDRLNMLSWLVLAKSMTLCDSEYRPLTQHFVHCTDGGKNSEMRLNVVNCCETCSKDRQTYETIINSDKLVQNISAVKVLEKISSKTNCSLFGDLDLLTNKTIECSLQAMKEMGIKDRERRVGQVRLEDFETALESIRDMQADNLDAPKIPKVYWQDIGGLEQLKRELLRSIELPIKYPHLLTNSGLKRSGVLLYGPPGCGKTLVAKALSTELKISFLSVKGPELLNMYVGQSEENVRKVFSVARSSAPCLIFLDELDALAPARGSAGDSGGVADRVVSQLLAELDGVNTNSCNETGNEGSEAMVFVMGATNRPDLIEQSLLRPGRLDKLILVGPYEGLQQKHSVLEALTRREKVSVDVDLLGVSDVLPPRCTGADIMQVVSTARMEAVRRIIKDGAGAINLTADDVVLRKEDFERSLETFVPSITEEDFQYFDQLKMQITS